MCVVCSPGVQSGRGGGADQVPARVAPGLARAAAALHAARGGGLRTAGAARYSTRRGALGWATTTARPARRFRHQRFEPQHAGIVYRAMNSQTYTCTLTLFESIELQEKYYNFEAIHVISKFDTTQIDYSEINNNYLTPVDQTKFVSVLKKTKC